MSDCKITDAALTHVRELPNLKELGLRNCQITDAGLANLEPLHKLNYLILDGTKITDAGLARVRNLNGLRYLSLINTRVSDAGLENLKGLGKPRTWSGSAERMSRIKAFKISRMHSPAWRSSGEIVSNGSHGKCEEQHPMTTIRLIERLHPLSGHGARKVTISETHVVRQRCGY